MSHPLLEGLAELEEVICEVTIIQMEGRTFVGAACEDWADAFSLCRTGSIDWIDQHPPWVVKLAPGDLEIDGVEYTVLLCWPTVKWTDETRAEFDPFGVHVRNHNVILKG